MGITRKRNRKIRIVFDKLNSEVGVIFNNLPFAAIMGVLIDYLNNNVRIVVGNLDSEIRVLGYNLNPAIQRNTFACAGICIDGLSRYKNREQCEYKTIY